MRNNYLKLSVLMSLLFVGLVLQSCDDKNDGPSATDSLLLAESIRGEWLLGTSTGEEWATFEFNTSRVLASYFQNGIVMEGSGPYFLNEESGSITFSVNVGNQYPEYGFWKASDVKAYQIDIDMLGNDGNTYIGSTGLYKIITTQEMTVGTASTPNYLALTATSVNGFISVDESVVTVDSQTGELRAVASGKTFVTFETEAGRAAIRVNVVASEISLSESLIGSWVVDVPGEIFEIDTFGENGAFYSEWVSYIGDKVHLADYGQGTYTVDETRKAVNIRVVTSQGVRLNPEYRLKNVTRNSYTIDVYNSGDFSASYEQQRVLASLEVEAGKSIRPDYEALVSPLSATSFKSHDTAIAAVDVQTGDIMAVAKGRTAIDVVTSEGTAAVVVNVIDAAFPIDYEYCLGKTREEVKTYINRDPTYDMSDLLAYKDFNSVIDLLVPDFDEAGSCHAVVISYKSDVDLQRVTAVLETNYNYLESQTTETFKAFMNCERRAGASVGVTWDLEKRSLVYQDIARDLFTDYSGLLGKTRAQTIEEMNMTPAIEKDDQLSFFFSDRKGVGLVTAFFTDLVTAFDTVQIVGVTLDGTLEQEDVKAYLSMKYTYYPQGSTDDSIMYVSEDAALGVLYMPEDDFVLYAPTKSSERVAARIRATRKDSVSRK